MSAAFSKKRYIYRQGLANLRIEGFALTRAQHKLALSYQKGKIQHREFLDKALAYARSR